MRIKDKEGINYDITLHYGMKSLCMDVWRDGEKDYIEHYKLYTMPELLKRLPFIKFDSPEADCIREMDSHIDSLKRITRLEEEMKRRI